MRTEGKEEKYHADFDIKEIGVVDEKKEKEEDVDDKDLIKKKYG